MNMIADADELERELRRILAYSQSTEPSRSRIASELSSLSTRLADNREKCGAEVGLNGEPDNSYGRGYFEPPAKIRNLGTYATA